MQEPSPEPSPRKKSVVVNAGPFASFAERRIASAMQKYIVPWSIAIHGLSYAKRMSIDSVKEMLIAIIDEKELMPGHPSCAKEVAKYPLAFGDFARKVKAAAGIAIVGFHVLYFTYCFAWADSVPARPQSEPWANTVSL